MTNPVPDHSAEELLRRAVENARDRKANKGVKHARWVAVMDVFLLGSTYSALLCRWAGVDPDEQVKR